MGNQRKERVDVQSEERAKRVPLGVLHSKLTVADGIIPATHVGRWVNDADNRLQMAVHGGYAFVENNGRWRVGEEVKDGNTDLGNKISRVVDSTTGMRAYLMMIPKEYYEEDQETKQSRVDEVDAQIKKGGYKAQGLEPGNAYGEMKYQP